MIDVDRVLGKLKTILKVKTDLQFAKILNVKGNTISSWRTRNTMPFDTIIILCRKHNIDLNELFFDVSSLYNSYQEIDETYKNKIKIISSSMHFQYVLEGNDSIPEGPNFDFLYLENCEIAFQVISDNMSPTIRIRNIVLCERTSIDSLLSGAIYVVVSMRKGISVHRFERVLGRDELLFANDNSLYNNELVFAKDISEIWKVKSAFIDSLVS